MLLIISFILPHKYSASASVMPPSSKSGGGLSGFLQSIEGSLPLGSLGEGGESAVYAEILKSRSAADYVIENTDIDSVLQVEQRQQLYNALKGITNVVVEKSGLINVYVDFKTGMLPDKNETETARRLVTDMANSYVDALDHIIRRQDQKGARESRKYINKEINNYKMKLDSIESSIVEFQENNNVLELTEQTQAVAQQGLELAQELAVSEMEYKIAKRRYSEKSPQLQAYREKYNILQEQYERVQTGGLIPTDKFSLSVEQIPELIREYTDLMRSREIMEKVLLYLQTQYFQDAIEEQKNVAVVEILDRAVEPYQRSAPSRAMFMILGTIIIAFLIIVYVLLNAFIKGKLFVNKMT